jgi:hypothetical protein
MAAAAVLLCGYTPAIVLIAVFSTGVLWLYGSFWMTAAIVLVGGESLMMPISFWDSASISSFFVNMWWLSPHSA